MGKGVVGGKGQYYHQFNPYKFHPTQQAAARDQARLRGISKPRKPRVSTFYTFLQDKRKNNPPKFGNVPQGPHTLPFHALHHAIATAYASDKLDELKPMVMDPATYATRVNAEIPAGHAKAGRAQTAIVKYTKAHAGLVKLQALKPRTEADSIKYAHRINRLVQMDPFGTYGYKGKGAGNSSLKGKGERSTKPLAQQIDFPANAGFANAKKVRAHHQTHLATLAKLGIT